MTTATVQLNTKWQQIAPASKYVTVQKRSGDFQWAIDSTAPNETQLGIFVDDGVTLATPVGEQLYIKGDGEIIVVTTDV